MTPATEAALLDAAERRYAYLLERGTDGQSLLYDELVLSREEGAYGDLEAYSPNSPLGRALLDAKVGETREYELPNGGTMKVTLLKAEPFRG